MLPGRNAWEDILKEERLPCITVSQASLYIWSLWQGRSITVGEEGKLLLTQQAVSRKTKSQEQNTPFKSRHPLCMAPSNSYSANGNWPGPTPWLQLATSGSSLLTEDPWNGNWESSVWISGCTSYYSGAGRRASEGVLSCAQRHGVCVTLVKVERNDVQQHSQLKCYWRQRGRVLIHKRNERDCVCFHSPQNPKEWTFLPFIEH